MRYIFFNCKSDLSENAIDMSSKDILSAFIIGCEMDVLVMFKDEKSTNMLLDGDQVFK